MNSTTWTQRASNVIADPRFNVTELGHERLDAWIAARFSRSQRATLPMTTCARQFRIEVGSGDARREQFSRTVHVAPLRAMRDACIDAREALLAASLEAAREWGEDAWATFTISCPALDVYERIAHGMIEVTKAGSLRDRFGIVYDVIGELRAAIMRNDQAEARRSFDATLTSAQRAAERAAKERS